MQEASEETLVPLIMVLISLGLFGFLYHASIVSLLLLLTINRATASNLDRNTRNRATGRGPSTLPGRRDAIGGAGNR